MSFATQRLYNRPNPLYLLTLNFLEYLAHAIHLDGNIGIIGKDKNRTHLIGLETSLLYKKTGKVTTTEFVALTFANV